jgi:hypothetical protein
MKIRATGRFHEMEETVLAIRSYPHHKYRPVLDVVVCRNITAECNILERFVLSCGSV